MIPVQIITNADNADEIALLANTPTQAETLLHRLERAAFGIGLYVNADETEYMCFNQRGDITTLNGSSLKLVDKFTYLGSSASSTETDINTWLAKVWKVIDRLSVIWKSALTDKIKRSLLILLYECTTWTLTKHIEKNRDGNYTKMLSALEAAPDKATAVPPTTKTIQVRRTRHPGHWWRSRDDLISDVLWTSSYGRAKAGRPARNYIQQHSADTECSLEDLPGAMDDREERWERVRDIHAGSATWWWWWYIEIEFPWRNG